MILDVNLSQKKELVDNVSWSKEQCWDQIGYLRASQHKVLCDGRGGWQVKDGHSFVLFFSIPLVDRQKLIMDWSQSLSLGDPFSKYALNLFFQFALLVFIQYRNHHVLLRLMRKLPNWSPHFQSYCCQTVDSKQRSDAVSLSRMNE